MSQNDSNDHNPWQRKPDQGPPDLLKEIKRFFQKYIGAKKPSGPGQNGSSSAPLPILLYVGIGFAVLLIIWALSGIFIVSASQEATILRFGKYVQTVGPGPHWIPPIIDSQAKVNVQQVSNFNYHADMLTKDENIVVVKLAVQYRISDPKNYLYSVVNPLSTLKEATSSAVRSVVGHMGLDTILTKGRSQLRQQVEQQLIKMMAFYKNGLTVTDVNLQLVRAPNSVAQAFDDAIKAREDEQRYINQANAYSRKVESIAKGKSSRLLQSAKAYQKEVVLNAKGNSSRYLALVKPYQQAPNLMRERLYLETVSSVLSKTTNIVMDGSGNNVLYLPLDRILQQHAKSSVPNVFPARGDA